MRKLKNKNVERSMYWYVAPRYWLTWSGIFSIWVLAKMPYAMQMFIGRLLGLFAYLIARGRRGVCETNLTLCFPELTTKQLKKLTIRTFISNGIGLVEVALAWCRNPEDFRNRVTVHGLHHLNQAKEQGRGVLLLCAHFTTLELSGALLSLFQQMDVTYRKHKNPLFEAFMLKSRKRIYRRVIEREDVRTAMRSLKEGNILWYAPDQDYGARRAVFVPFFGVRAATITATSRFAKFNNSPVIFFSHHRKSNNAGYQLNFSPIIEDYPLQDEERNAIKINRIIEEAVREHPEQYLWLHRRFKTQPGSNSGEHYQS